MSDSTSTKLKTLATKSRLKKTKTKVTIGFAIETDASPKIPQNIPTINLVNQLPSPTASETSTSQTFTTTPSPYVLDLTQIAPQTPLPKPKVNAFEISNQKPRGRPSFFKQLSRLLNTHEIPRTLSVKPDGLFTPTAAETLADVRQVVKQKIFQAFGFVDIKTTPLTPKPLLSPPSQDRSYDLPKTNPASFLLATILITVPVITVALTWKLSRLNTLKTSGQNIVNQTQELKTALQNGDLVTSENTLSKIQNNLDLIDAALGSFKPMLRLATFARLGSVANLAPLLDAAQDLTTFGLTAIQTAKTINAKSDLAQKISILTMATANLKELTAQAQANLNKINLDLIPTNYQTTVAGLQTQTNQLNSIVQNLNTAGSSLPEFLGFNGTRQYLLLFQNNTEVRASGGFIGSFATLTLKNGQIANYNIPASGPYALPNDLKVRLAAPRPLRLINPIWQFQDANWYPNFETTAQTAARLFEKSGGATVDGVVAINANVIEQLLKILGPIAMPSYNKNINANNFVSETQKAVELEYNKTQNQPKQFIADLAPLILERLKTAPANQQKQILNLVVTNIKSHDLQSWINQPQLQNLVQSVGLSGNLNTAPSDYLAVVHTNIAGEKSDAAINNLIDKTTKLLPDGSVIETVELTRVHTGIKGELFRGVRNVDYVRFYVPRGSTLISATGFNPPNKNQFKVTGFGANRDPGLAQIEDQTSTDQGSGTDIFEESGKTVFGNWILTDPGTRSKVTVKYALPKSILNFENKNIASYSSFFQKQSGVAHSQITESLDLPQNARLVKSTYQINGSSSGSSSFWLDQDHTTTAQIDFGRNAYAPN